ncbi:hypothetical protein UB23_07470 [Pseudomonas sp. ES3-33]|nr:hypothetical protein UB23_07470 [Pseudomonas sp. ES3-33]
MFWFRHRHPAFIGLTIVLWAIAFDLAASLGCLAQPSQTPATAQALMSTVHNHESYDAHAPACLQHCADAVIAVSPSLHLQIFELSSWMFLFLIPALLILYPSNPCAFAFLVLRRPMPARRPTRLIFVRFND